MKKLNSILCLLLFFVMMSLSGFAQNAVITISKDSIVIGDQLSMQLMVPADAPGNVRFPAYNEDTVTEGVFVLADKDVAFNQDKKLVSKDYVVAAFEAGNYTVPPQSIRVVAGSDTLIYLSDSVQFFVKPAVVVDTLPVDTVYADKSGVIIMGRNGFSEEIEQQIPDSIKQSMSADSLTLLKQQVKQNMTSQFSGQIFRVSGLRSEKDILQIVDAPKKQLFIVNDKSIREQMRIPGAYDTVFVQEFDTVISSQALFTVYDIKDIHDDFYETKFNLKELFFYIWKFLKANWWWLLAVFVLAIAAIYYFLYYKKGKPVFQVKEKVKEPAHVIAFRELERIRNEKLWLKNQIKTYYTQLTDTLRKYLENRYDLLAMEKTSAEILDDLNETKYLDDDLVIKLREVLQRADFVKFAKSMPLPDENEKSLKLIWEIVARSKRVEITESYKPEQTEKDTMNKESNN
ncbi:MAG: hypothetical protein PF448_07930 [Bacteroidales bacterium]|jgi:hypothetical protein|nr:hypothetical protein [Bacteroidales bacterium]